MVASHPALAAQRTFVDLPRIRDNTVSARVVYVENPRFPGVGPDGLRRVLDAAAALVQEHFGVTVVRAGEIRTMDIADVFAAMVRDRPDGFDDLIGDFRNDRVDWPRVRASLIEQIQRQQDPLSRQIDFARPYLVRPLRAETLQGFADAIIETFRTRLSHWTRARLADGHPVIGWAPGYPDLPYNEYGYWALMAKLGIDAEIVLTNQLVASVEYMAVPVHTSIRGGITGGSTEYNPSSRLGASVWVSLFPFLFEDPHIVALRNGERYEINDALTYAGAMLAHELGHLVFQLGHPWSNEACLMRPAAALDFSGWLGELDAARCRIGSSPAMTPGTMKAPIW
jgi:hypothetical protein